MNTPLPLAVVVSALLTTIVAGASSRAILAAPVGDTPLPAIAQKKMSCPKKLYKLSGEFPVTVIVAAEKGQHPSAALLTCASAYAIVQAGKRHFLNPPFRTGAKIDVAGATYTLGVGGPEILPATSGPVYGWFGNGIEVVLIVPSGR
jgi:hypothetical protein